MKRRNRYCKIITFYDSFVSCAYMYLEKASVHLARLVLRLLVLFTNIQGAHWFSHSGRFKSKMGVATKKKNTM